jgi:hypothetical protein
MSSKQALQLLNRVVAHRSEDADAAVGLEFGTLSVLVSEMWTVCMQGTGSWDVARMKSPDVHENAHVRAF